MTLAIFIAGCENPFNSNDEVQLDAEELELFSSDLETDLGLSGTSANILRSALNRHGNGGRWNNDPGFLWKLAAELHEKLSDEEKEKIFARMQRMKERGKNDKDGKGNEARGHDKGKDGAGAFRAILSVLTDEQKVTFDEIMTDFRTQMAAIHESAKAGEMTKQEAGDAMKLLHESLKEALDKLLTDEQKAELEQMKEEYEARKKEFVEAVEAAKIEVLGLTDEQLAALEAARAEAKRVLESLKAKVDSGEMTKQEAGEAMKEIWKDQKDKSAEILKESQIEIMKIHSYLQIRWHHRHGPRGEDGDGRGG
ncbi:MAG: hypothetical protein CMG71_04580 [Candidatus Marinimicrobia bacterium]|nr:hypothetical protein [Candidatus Neomarinimicrobiota bacterium]|tara:strand:- start:2465 stop:3394 length:930 start_codon:yes stop_codon:yes gene_type:complete